MAKLDITMKLHNEPMQATCETHAPDGQRMRRGRRIAVANRCPSFDPSFTLRLSRKALQDRRADSFVPP